MVVVMFSLECQSTGGEKLENTSGKEKLLNVDKTEEVKQLLEKLPHTDKTSENINKPNNNFESNCKVLK